MCVFMTTPASLFVAVGLHWRDLGLLHLLGGGVCLDHRRPDDSQGAPLQFLGSLFEFGVKLQQASPRLSVYLLGALQDSGGLNSRRKGTVE
jgi:hypothetical protein